MYTAVHVLVYIENVAVLFFLVWLLTRMHGSLVEWRIFRLCMTETTYNLNYICYKALIWSFLILILVVYLPLFQCFRSVSTFIYIFTMAMPFSSIYLGVGSHSNFSVFLGFYPSLSVSFVRSPSLGPIFSSSIAIEQIMIFFCFVYIIKLFIYIRKVLVILCVHCIWLVLQSVFVRLFTAFFFFRLDIGRVVSPLYCTDSNNIAFESVKWITK